MKTKIFIYPFIVMGFAFVLTQSCKKDNNNDLDTTGQVPVLTTDVVTNIIHTSATCGGSISNDGGLTITARGICWSTGQTPTISDNKTIDGTGAGNFTSTATGLIPATSYYLRAYATNSAGIGYGSAMSFTTQQAVTDIDGNFYQMITIGTQVWMGENLKVTHYLNGDPIPNVTGDLDWSILNTGALCNYGNIPENSMTYGALYNWYAVNDSRGIAPAGWHIPTDAEWDILTTFLGGSSVAGGLIKSTGTIEAGDGYWFTPNTGATNANSFSAYPAGTRDAWGPFINLGYEGHWWSATSVMNISVWTRGVNYNNTILTRYPDDLTYGFSVRCVKD